MAADSRIISIMPNPKNFDTQNQGLHLSGVTKTQSFHQASEDQFSSLSEADTRSS